MTIFHSFRPTKYNYYAVYIFVQSIKKHIYSTGKAQLRLSCSNSVATVEVVTPGKDVEINSTKLEGKCFIPELPFGTSEVC